MQKIYSNLLYLIRHGENPANLTHEFSYKIVDYSLTPKGKLQAQQTAEYFADKHIDEIYSSPLRRARETAEPIAAVQHLPVTVMEEFREINVGALEGSPPTSENWQLHNQIVQDWFEGNHDRTFPGGENYTQLLTRLRAGLRRVTQGKTSKHIVIVGHGGIFTRTMQDICPTIDVEVLLHTPNSNCSITQIELVTNDDTVQGTMLRWAALDHLHGEAANVVPGTVLNEPPIPVKSQI